MEEFKSTTKLKEIQNRLYKIRIQVDEYQEQVDDLESKIDDLEDEIEFLENEENRLSKSARIDLKNKYTGNEFEDKLVKATLFTNTDGISKSVNYVYIDKNSIYAIDGYRAMEYKHKNKDINKTMFTEPENVLDLSKFKEVDNSKDTKGIEVTKKIMTKDFNETTGDILNIDGDYFINEFLYKEVDGERYKTYIFDLKEFRIAVNKDFIEDMLFIFKNKKFDVAYSENLKPIFFYNDEIKIVILPIRFYNIENL